MLLAAGHSFTVDYMNYHDKVLSENFCVVQYIFSFRFNLVNFQKSSNTSKPVVLIVVL